MPRLSASWRASRDTAVALPLLCAGALLSLPVLLPSLSAPCRFRPSVADARPGRVVCTRLHPLTRLAFAFARSPCEMTTTARITSDQLSSPRFQGQAVRAVGKLVGMDDSTVQLQLAGPEGARRRRRTIIINPSRPHGPPLDTTSA